MLELVRRHPRYGYPRITALSRQEGRPVNRKRIHRLWRQEGLKVPLKQGKRRRLGHSANGVLRRRAEHPNHVWCYDFLKDQTTDGRPLKLLPIEDEYTRESLAVDGAIRANGGSGWGLSRRGAGGGPTGSGYRSALALAGSGTSSAARRSRGIQTRRWPPG